MNTLYGPGSLTELGNICNTPDRQRLRSLLNEHSYFCRIQRRSANDRYVLQYWLPEWMQDFFLDPNRSRYLYSTSLVIDTCQKAIENLILDPTSNSDSMNLVDFFAPLWCGVPIGNIANATHLLERAGNGSNRNELLLFLEYLSKIHWLDVYNGNEQQGRFTNGIVHWVCTTLVGQFLPTRFDYH